MMTEKEADRMAGETASAVSRDALIAYFFGDKPGQIRLKTLRTRLRQSLSAKETKVFNGTSGIVYSKDLINHTVRLNAQKLCFELLGVTDDKRHEVHGELIVKWQE